MSDISGVTHEETNFYGVIVQSKICPVIRLKELSESKELYVLLDDNGYTSKGISESTKPIQVAKYSDVIDAVKSHTQLNNKLVRELDVYGVLGNVYEVVDNVTPIKLLNITNTYFEMPVVKGYKIQYE